MLTRKAKYFLSLSAIAPLLFAGACTDNNILSPGNVAGTYTLTNFNGTTTFPASFNESAAANDPDLPNGGIVTVNGGDIILRNDGTFTETNDITKTPPGGSTFQSNFVSVGTYTLSGNTIQFFAPAQNGYQQRNFSGNISSNQIVYVENQEQFVYER